MQAKELAGIVKTLAESNARGKELKGEEEARTKEGIDMLAKTSALRANIETWTTDQQDILSTAALEQATTMPPFFLSFFLNAVPPCVTNAYWDTTV